MIQKTLRYTISAVLLMLLVACSSHKDMATGGASADGLFAPADFLKQVTAQNIEQKYITSKLKFSLATGSKDVSVSGSLKMKRDAVIRIQLTALGLMEVGRLEFTPDYVLIMDRVNKQYIKAPYAQVDFLKRSGITFYTLQSLFWNELFQPGKKSPDLKHFVAQNTDNEVRINLDNSDSRLDYQWNAQRNTALITQAQVTHTGAQFSWKYDDFKKLGQRLFPNNMQVKLQAGSKDVNVGFKLSSVDDDDDWEPYTKVSSRYKQVTAEDILRKLMSM